MINKHHFKPVRSVSPVLLQIKSQVGGNNLATPIRHPASFFEFPHAGINQGHSSLTISPPLDYVGVNAPIVNSFAIHTILVEKLGTVVVGEKYEKVTPEKL